MSLDQGCDLCGRDMLNPELKDMNRGLCNSCKGVVRLSVTDRNRKSMQKLLRDKELRQQLQKQLDG